MAPGEVHEEEQIHVAAPIPGQVPAFGTLVTETVLKQCWSSVIGMGLGHAVSELWLDSVTLVGPFQHRIFHELVAAQEECSQK